MGITIVSKVEVRCDVCNGYSNIQVDGRVSDDETLMAKLTSIGWLPFVDSDGKKFICKDCQDVYKAVRDIVDPIIEQE